MNTLSQNQKVVRGLSIAAIVIAGLSVIGSLITLFTASAGLAAVNETIDAYSSYSSYYGYGYSYYYYDPDELAAASFAMTLLVAYGVFALIASAFSVFASIFTLINFKSEQKLKTIFVLAIIGAAVSLLMIGIVEVVLFVLIAVFVNKLRKAGTAPAPMAGATPAAVAAAASAPAPAPAPAPTPAPAPAAALADQAAAPAASAPVPPAPPAPGAAPVATNAPALSVPDATVREVEEELDAELAEVIAEEEAADAEADALGDAIAAKEIDQAVNGAKEGETDVLTEVIATKAVSEVTHDKEAEDEA